MNITMTVEVTPEQAVRIADILKEPAPNKSYAPVPVQQPIVPPVQPAVPPAPIAPAQVPAAPASAVPGRVPVVPAPVPTAMPSPVPVQQPAPTASLIPPAAAPAMAAPPTAVKKYTADELSLASRPIVEAGRQQELLDLLHSFTFTDANGVTRNVQNIRELPEELYPAFANGIRQLGGRI